MAVRTWKQPKCPSTEEWIKKMWYIYTMEYYSAIKSNEMASFAETWMSLEIVYRVKSEIEKQISCIKCIYIYIYIIYKNGIDGLICKAEIDTQDIENKHMDTRGKGSGRGIEMGRMD